jgi:hypothetical protein
MNLLEKYQAMIKKPNAPSLSLVVDNKPSTDGEVSNRLAITPPEIVEPGANTKSIWVNPYPQGTKEARIESLTQCIGAIFQESFKKVRKIYEKSGTQFKGTPEILDTEQRIEALQSAVLNGEAKINDFQLCVYDWERANRAVLN